MRFLENMKNTGLFDSYYEIPVSKFNPLHLDCSQLLN